MDTQPQLEIGADEVRCTHGATVGPLSQDELYYLQTRGLSRQLALAMLAEGFTMEVVRQIENRPARGAVGAAVTKRLREMLAPLATGAGTEG